MSGASEASHIPHGFVQLLHENIQKAIDDADNVVPCEFFENMHGIRNVKM